MTDESIAKMKELVYEGYRKGKVLPVSEAFDLYPVEEEVHKGELEYWIQGAKQD